MENQKDDILMKPRSSRACIGAGYRLYTGNFKRIFRYSWVAALVYAMVCSAGGTLMILRPQAVLITIGIILVAEALFVSYGFAVLKQHQTSVSISLSTKWFNIDTHIFTRTLKAWLYVAGIFLEVGIVVGGIGLGAVKMLSPYTALGCIGVASIIAACLLLPMMYVVPRYILNDGVGFWSQLKVGYPVGLRRWGFIFTVIFVVTLVLMGLQLITSLPASILTLANMSSARSMMMGDPSGMPSYIGWLAAATFLLIGFIQAYVQLSALFPTYYMYGSIDVQEQERKEFNQNKLTTI
jgi:hypothetical protein